MQEGNEPCPNCQSPDQHSFEISRLIEQDGELHETPLVTILHLCEFCLTLMTGSNWSALEARRTAPRDL